MIDREILLIAVGGLIGAFSSIATLLVSYFVEGIRLRRQWAREDQLLLQKQRQALRAVVNAADESEQVPEKLP